MNAPISEADLRQQLLARDAEYKRLAAEHQSYDEQLAQLSRRPHLSDAEKMQEVMLKKKKLMLKDQMYSLVQKFRGESKAGM